MDEVYKRAAGEWLRYRSLHGIAGEVRLDTDDQSPLPEDGYSIRTTPEGGSVTAKTARGLLHGVFRLMQLCEMHGHALPALNEEVSPFTQLRMLWSWSRIDGNYRHPPYAGIRSMIDIAAMENPEESPEMLRFLRHAASMGANALAITHELHHGELEDWDQHGFRPYYGAIRSFSAYLRQWGLDLYLYTTAAPEREWKRRVDDTDCPFDPRVRAFVDDFAAEIGSQLPDVKGLLLVGGLGGYGGGRLYDCRCACCQGKDPLQRVEEQIRVYGEALGSRGMKLVYTLTTDDPFTMDREVDAALSLMDRVADNVTLTFKDCFHDFEDLRYPEHPLFSSLEQGADGGSLAVEYQLFPEMRGKDSVLSGAVFQWSSVFRLAKARNIRGAIGVVENHPRNDHPTMADWYCFGRLCADPDADPGELLREWALLNYPPELADALLDIMSRAPRAASRMLYAGGVQCGIHGSIIPYPHFVCDIVNDTWCTVEKQPHGIIGNSGRLGRLYSPGRGQEITGDPGNLLFIQALEVSEEVKAALMEEKEEAIRLYDGIYDSWRLAVDQTGAQENEACRRLLALLERNKNDARRFAAYFELFLDWQMNRATPAQVEVVRAAHIGTGAPCSISTCDEVFGAFLTRLNHRLEGIPFEETFDCMYDLPLFSPGQADAMP